MWKDVHVGEMCLSMMAYVVYQYPQQFVSVGDCLLLAVHTIDGKGV